MSATASRVSLFLALTAFAVLLVGCGPPAPPPPAPRQAGPEAPPPVDASATAIRGQLAIDGLERLPGKLELRLRLLDMSDPSVAPPVLAERVEPAPAALPYRYALPYDKTRIADGGKYAVDAAIMTQGVVLYGTPQRPAVLSNGKAGNVALTLTRGGQPLAEIAPAERMLQEFEALENSVGGMDRVTGERIEEAVTIGWDAFAEGDEVRYAREAVDSVDGGSSSYRYAYVNGQPWVIAREQNGDLTLLGWGEDGDVMLNRVGEDGQLDADAIAQLRARSERMLQAVQARLRR